MKTGNATNHTNQTNEEPSSLVLDSPVSWGNPRFRGVITAAPGAPSFLFSAVPPFVSFVYFVVFFSVSSVV